jgi:hypothetical protein
VLSRSGERVYLRHLRIGGKVYTKAVWLGEFGRMLAEADAAYFRHNEDGIGPPPLLSRPKRRRRRFEQHRRKSIEHATGELEDAGL